MSIGESRPQQIEGIQSQDLGDETMLYDTRTENVHVLNSTARAIWNLCDGVRTVDDIQAALAGEYTEIDPAQVVQDVQDTIADFAQKKLVKMG